MRPGCALWKLVARSHSNTSRSSDPRHKVTQEGNPQVILSVDRFLLTSTVLFYVCLSSYVYIQNGQICIIVNVLEKNLCSNKEKRFPCLRVNTLFIGVVARTCEILNKLFLSNHPFGQSPVHITLFREELHTA